MSAALLKSMDVEQSFYDMLNDPQQMEDFLAEWTNEPSTNDSTEQCVDPAILQQDNTQNSLGLLPFSSPQATVGAQDLGIEQRYVSYPETPSLTTRGWAPQINHEGKGQYDEKPSLFGGVIDPQLLPMDPMSFNPTTPPPALPSQINYLSSVIHALSGTNNPGVSSSGSSTTRKRKQAPTSPEQEIPTKQAKTTCYPSRAPRSRHSNPNGIVPLSIRTTDSSIPLKDMRAQIMRPAERRQREAEFGRNSKKQAIPRPMNSFMLYRAAYMERIQALGRQVGSTNNQVVSSVAGESWQVETEEVRREFADLAELDKKMHQVAFPKYKYKPAQK